MKTTINGYPFEFEPRHDETAIDVLRDRAGLTGTKLACGGGICGACTVRVDGVPKCSCLLPATQMDGADIRTIEEYGLDNLHPVQRAFMANEGLQCGFCTPGFINEGIVFYDRWRAEHGKTAPSRHEVALAMGGHLCRCAAYVGIFAAIQKACAGDYDDVTDSPIYRVDAPEKVTGTAKYTVDTKLGDDQLVGKQFRSAYPSAIVKNVDTSAALALDGVIAIADLLEGKDRVRWVGQPIVGVAAVDERTANAALKLIEVDYEVLPAVIGLEQAMAPDAPDVWEVDRGDMPSAAELLSMPYAWDNNVGKMRMESLLARNPRRAKREILEAHNAQSNDLVERTYYNAQQVHTPLEPHATVAKWDGPDKVHVVTSSQNIADLRGQIAKYFDLDVEHVTLESVYIGGGFGGKQGLYRETKAAIALARAANRPVLVKADRVEELSYTSLRPAIKSEVALLVKKDGTPEALHMDAYGDAGIASGTIPGMLVNMVEPRRMYRDVQDFVVVNNTAPGTPYRGPDGAPARWAIDSAIDEAAAKHDLNPVEIRRRWWPDHEIKNRLLDFVESIPEWQARTDNGADKGRFRRGIGLATAQWLFGYEPNTEIEFSVSTAGIRIRCATQDIGNGTRTTIAKAVEDVMGISRNEVHIDIGNASYPEGPITGGSMVTTSVYPPTYSASQKAMARLEQVAINQMGLQDVQTATGGVNHANGFTSWQAIMKEAEPFSLVEKRRAERVPLGLHRLNIALPMGFHFSHGVVVTEVEVDTRLGKIRPLNVWNAVAAGKIHVPMLAASQMYSASIQGLGYALYEKKEYDLNSGYTLSANLNDYRIPGIGDTPNIHVHFDEEGYEDVTNGGIGFAELCIVGVAASAGNAVFNATGWRPTRTPITPHDIVTGLKEAT